MRTQHFLVLAAAATLSASAFADPSVATANAGNTVTVQASPASYYRMSPADAQHMKGAFQLADGRVLTVTNQRSKLFAEVDGKKEELVQVGPQRFVARDSGARVAFDQVPYAGEVTLNQAPPARLYGDQAAR
jgi:hypothetical protein